MEEVERLDFFDSKEFYLLSIEDTNIGTVTKNNFTQFINVFNACLKENKMMNLTGLENLKWED